MVSCYLYQYRSEMGLEVRRYVVGADALATMLYLVSSTPQGRAKNEMKLTLTWHKLVAA
jgi:hypothetical protein